MKIIRSLFVVGALSFILLPLCLLPSCSTTGGVSSQQVSAVVTSALAAYGTYEDYKSGKITQSQAITQAANDVAGMAAAAQANQGAPTTAVVQGAANPVPAAQVAAVLPSSTLSQADVNTLWAAYQQLQAKAATSTPAK